MQPRAALALFLALTTSAQTNIATRRELSAGATAAGAVALDGSPYIYYVAPGAETTKFVISQKGGGWCYSDLGCAERAETSLGSSNATFYPSSIDYSTFDGPDKYMILHANSTYNPQAWNWTRVYLPYLDGGSQVGDLDAPVVVPLGGGKTRTIFYRGKRIHDATVSALLAHEGLSSATDVIIHGGSAGGLATYLHTDDWAARLPRTAKIVAVPDSGFFLNYNATEGHGFAANMRWVATRMNGTGGLPAACVAANVADPALCIFAEVVARTLKTPVFAQQSTYDTYQIAAILDEPLTNSSAINAYGAMLDTRLRAALIEPHADAAVFLDSCAHHVGAWDEIIIDGMLVHEALQAFYASIGLGGKRVWAQGRAYPCAACCARGQATS
jgi:hypothetical protein